jgi:hypothetical protein
MSTTAQDAEQYRLEQARRLIEASRFVQQLKEQAQPPRVVTSVQVANYASALKQPEVVYLRYHGARRGAERRPEIVVQARKSQIRAEKMAGAGRQLSRQEIEAFAAERGVTVSPTCKAPGSTATPE